MQLFLPSKKSLEAICWDALSVRTLHQFTADISEEPGLNSYLNSYLNFIESYFNNRLMYERDEIIYELPESYKECCNFAVHVSLEGLRNAKYHGSKKGTDFCHLIYLSSGGVAQGFYDDGDYFKKSEIKNQYENRKEITDFDLDHTFGFRFGVNGIIFQKSDMIEVDTLNGILWTIHLVKKR